MLVYSIFLCTDLIVLPQRRPETKTRVFGTDRGLTAKILKTSPITRVCLLRICAIPHVHTVSGRLSTQGSESHRTKDNIKYTFLICSPSNSGLVAYSKYIFFARRVRPSFHWANFCTLGISPPPPLNTALTFHRVPNARPAAVAARDEG